MCTSCVHLVVRVCCVLASAIVPFVSISSMDLVPSSFSLVKKSKSFLLWLSLVVIVVASVVPPLV